MKWFGTSWNAPINQESEHVATPVDDICMHCTERIAAADDGVIIPHRGETVPNCDYEATAKPYHRECFLRITLGSLAHLERRCSCYGGHDLDDPNLSPRENAQAVDRWAMSRQWAK
jgi:hypothetical protein